MLVDELAVVHLTYTALESLDYEMGGQLYGTMEGSATGDRLSGALHLTNIAPRRPDNVNVPTLRGILTTTEGAQIWVELDGIATLRQSDHARVFVTRCVLRSGHPRYLWVNTTFAVLEGVLDRVAVGGSATCVLHRCEATVEHRLA